MPESSGVTSDAPRRGEVWFADLSPTQGHEQAGRRPILIISTNAYNAGHSGMVIALPLTSRIRPLASHVRVRPPEGGLKVVSDILCGQVRALSRDRLIRRWGNVAPATLAAAANVLRLLLEL